MAEKGRIKAELASGIKDYLPKDMIPRQIMFDRIRESFERFGFVPLDTPALEKMEVLTGGDPDFRMQIFRAGVKDLSEELALRFDLTVPLARVIAQYGGQIPRPFKRYQMGKVWRGEKSQAGRYREFVQFDADIIGSARTSADAEIIALMFETLKRLEVERFIIRVNNRKVLNGLPDFAGFDPSLLDQVLRQIDKLDELGWDNISGQMNDVDGISLKALANLKSFLELRGASQVETIGDLQRMMSDSDVAMEGIRELGEISTNLEALGVPFGQWAIDLSVARGLGYYTGPVFETVLLDLPSIGSVFSGGRYDGLVARFGVDSVPATGASVGVDRLFTALKELGRIRDRKSSAAVCVLNFDPNGEVVCNQVATILRGGGVNTEVYLGREITLKAQLAYAVSQEFPVCILIGPDERSRGVVKVKNMTSRSQIEVSIQDVLSSVREIVESVAI